MAQHKRHNATTPWYSTNSAKLGFGIAGILALASLLFVMNILANNGKQTTPTPSSSSNLPPIQDGVQVIKMAITQNGYEPNALTVKAGIPVRWEIDGSGVTGCTRNLVSPTFGINKRLDAGQNIIEFTPTQTGDFAFHCSMNMVRGTMHVI